MTIIMIAHRISTIQSAQNLLYLEDSSSVLSAVKGTQEYDKLISLLVKHNYAHQKDDKKDEKTVQDTDKVVAAETDDNYKLRAPEKGKIITLDDLDKIKNMKAVASANQGWRRIMSYYTPVLLSVFTFMTAIVNSCAFPGLGLITGKF